MTARRDIFILCATFSIFILINCGSGDSHVNVTRKGDSVAMVPLKNNINTIKENAIFGGSLDGIDLAVIPGLRDEDDFEHWNPPIAIQRDFSNYLAGFDNKGRPIWVYESGRYNFGKYLNGNKTKQDLLDKYFRYMTYLNLKSQSIKRTKERPVNQTVYIVDHEGFKSEFVADPRVFRWFGKLVRQYRQCFELYTAKMIFININPTAEILLTSLRPYLGRILGRIEIYGTNKYEWRPKLSKYVSPNQLPEWYGGQKGFKPLFVLG